jgi:hypothetical protein
LPSTELWKLPRPKVRHELLRDWAPMSFHRVSVKRHQSPSTQALQHGGGGRAVTNQAHRFTHGDVRQVRPGRATPAWLCGHKKSAADLVAGEFRWSLVFSCAPLANVGSELALAAAVAFSLELQKQRLGVGRFCLAR